MHFPFACFSYSPLSFLEKKKIVLSTNHNNLHVSGAGDKIVNKAQWENSK